jgi:hypothetical protein
MEAHVSNLPLTSWSFSVWPALPASSASRPSVVYYWEKESVTQDLHSVYLSASLFDHLQEFKGLSNSRHLISRLLRLSNLGH